MQILQFITACSPIILPLVFLVIFRISGKKGMPLSSIIVIILAAFVWKMQWITIFASILQGFHQAITILLILFGAILLLNVLKKTGAVSRINIMFSSISEDMRVQAVMLAYLFVALIEGAAGFGTPAAVVAPLMILLGFNPVAAATLSLIGDSACVSFGAISTPITVGLGKLVSENDISIIGKNITLMDLMVGIFVPLIIVFVLTQLFSKEKKNIKHFVELIPWCLLIGISYSLVAVFSTHFLGNDFVSILSPLVTMVVASYTAKNKILIPKTVWKGAMVGTLSKEKSDMSLLAAWSPYIIVVALLLITRLVPSIKWLTQQNFLTDIFSFNNILGTEISSGWQILYSPGVILIIAAVIAATVQSKNKNTFKESSFIAGKSLINATFALFGTLSMVYVFRNSAINERDFQSMPIYIAETLSVVGSSWFAFAPFIGQLGAFIAGSATVSTLTFAPIQASIAASVGLSQNVILAQQVMGGAVGNMFCVHNVVAATTVVGESGKEGDIIRKTLPPAIIMGLLSVIAAAVLLFIFGK